MNKPYQSVPLKTVREIYELIEAGVNVNYIAENTNLSWWTIHELGNQELKAYKTIKNVEKFLENKDFHLAKHKIINCFNVSKNAPILNLNLAGFSEWEISRIKNNYEKV